MEQYLNEGLHYAVRTNNLQTSRILIRLGADLNSTLPSSKCTPLGHAYNGQFYDIFKYLLEHGADGQDFLDCMFCNDEFNESWPLYCAVNLGRHPEVLRWLRDSGATPDMQTERWFRVLNSLFPHDFETGEIVGEDIDRLREQWFQLLWECNTSVNVLDSAETMILGGHSFKYCPDLTPNILKAVSWPLNYLKLILEKEAEVNVISYRYRDFYTRNGREDLTTPLHCASSMGSVEAVKLLHDRGAVHIRNGRKLAPCEVAYASCSTDVLKFFMQEGSPCKPLKKFKLHVACLMENVEEVQRLITEGADVNAVDTFSRFPLTFAVEKENMTLIKTLVEAGANPNPANATPNPAIATRRDDVHPIILAVSSGKVKAMAYFIEFLGDKLNLNEGYVNFPCKDKHRKLLTVTDIGKRKLPLEMVKLLLKHGADFTVLDPCRAVTPLMQAASGSNVDMELVKLLIEHGANVNDTAGYNTSDRGRSALHMCYNIDCVRYLLEHGAEVYVGRVVPAEGEKKKSAILALCLLQLPWNPEFVKELWEAYREELQDEVILLETAWRCGKLDIVEFLLSQNPLWFNNFSLDGSLFAVTSGSFHDNFVVNSVKVFRLGATFDFDRDVENRDKTSWFGCVIYTNHKFLFTKILQEGCGRAANVDGKELLSEICLNQDLNMIVLLRDLGYRIRESQLSLLRPAKLPNGEEDNIDEAHAEEADEFIRAVGKVYSQPVGLQLQCRYKIRGMLVKSKEASCPINQAIKDICLPEPIEDFLSFTGQEELAYYLCQRNGDRS